LYLSAHSWQGGWWLVAGGWWLVAANLIGRSVLSSRGV
jgi:hypothetical protein